MPEPQATIRVGILPSMIGQEGTTPIVVEIPRDTPQEQIQEVAIQALSERALGQSQQAQDDQTVKLGIGSGDNFSGIELPREGVEGANADILKAMPQIAGLIAQFTPVGKGMRASIGVPGVAELIRQVLEGEGLDLGKAGIQGAMGGAARTFGAGIEKVGRAGKGVVRRALNLPGVGEDGAAAAYDRLERLPAAAVRERASMTQSGAQRIRDKAGATPAPDANLHPAVRNYRNGNDVVTPPGTTEEQTLRELADVLDKGTVDAAREGNLPGGGPFTILQRFINRPKQMAVGRAMANPFGVDTEQTIAPASEASLKTLMAYLSTLLGGGDAEAPVASPGGPKRKPSR